MRYPFDITYYSYYYTVVIPLPKLSCHATFIRLHRYLMEDLNNARYVSFRIRSFAY